MRHIFFLFIGMIFGIILYKAEAASWFRIYEMFRFQSFHMYGLMGSALAIGIPVVYLIKRYKVRDFFNEPNVIPDKEKGIYRYLLGGIIFGLGWALAGSCPGPMFVLTGAGFFPIIIVILGAIAGTWIYGVIRDRLPH